MILKFMKPEKKSKIRIAVYTIYILFFNEFEKLFLIKRPIIPRDTETCIKFTQNCITIKESLFNKSATREGNIYPTTASATMTLLRLSTHYQLTYPNRHSSTRQN